MTLSTSPSPAAPLLTIVIVSYGSAAVLQKCQHAFLTANSFPVIIVDNASPDGSADTLAQLYPHAKLMRLARNEGFGRAANIGLRAAQTPWAFLLNPDLIVNTDDVQAMLDFARQQDSRHCLFGPAVTEKDFLKQGAISRQWLSGAALLFRRADFEKLGFFDENIFLYGEDDDLCRRVWESGHPLLLNSNLHMHHLRKQSSGSNPKIETLRNWHRGWSTIYFMRKHGDLRSTWAACRLWLRYWSKGALSFKPSTRRQNLERAAGMLACIRGEAAFLSDGRARGTDRL